MLKFNRSLLFELSYCFLLTVVFIFLRGYTFNNGDQAEHLPQLYEKIKPGTFKGDFFLENQSVVFSNRQFYVATLYILSIILPVEVLCFSLLLISIFCAIYGWMKVADQIANNLITKYLSVILIFFIFYGFTVGGNYVTYSIFITSVIGKAFVPWIILFFLQQKFKRAAVLLGVSTLFHAIVGIQLMVVLSILFLINIQNLHWKNFFTFIIVYSIVASTTLYSTVQLLFFSDFEYDKSFYNQIFYHFRNPHHYLPHTFPLKDWVKFGFILAIIILPAFKKEKSKGNVFIFQFITIQTLGLIFYTVVIEGFGIYTFNPLQWYKTTIWVTAFSSILLAEWISNTAFIKYYWDKFDWLFQNWKLNLSSAAIGLFFVLNSNWIPIEKFKTRYQIGNHKKTELQIVHEWIKENTSKGSLFVAPPSDFGFGCETQRPAIINAKALVHEPKYMLLWYERFTNIYKTRLEDLKGKSFVEVAEINYKKGDFNANSFGAKYGLVYKPLQRLDKVLFETENYAVVMFYPED